jgi:hypothetical protein
MRLAQIVMGKVLATLFLNFDVKGLNQMDGPPGPGGGKWTEEGSKYHNWQSWLCFRSPELCTD